MGHDSLYCGKWRKVQSHAMTLTLVLQCPISNLSEIFSYTTMYLIFMFIDQLLFELSHTHTHTRTRTHAHTRTHTHAHTDTHTHRHTNTLTHTLQSNIFLFGPGIFIYQMNAAYFDMLGLTCPCHHRNDQLSANWQDYLDTGY